MNGFFLKIRRNVNTGIKLFSIPYELFTNLNNIEAQSLYLFKNKHLQTNGYTLYNIGTLMYKNVRRNKVLETLWLFCIYLLIHTI